MYKFFKRMFDIILSFLAIVILSPVYLFMFISVALCIGRPVIFKQPRPGKNNKIFMLYKFRSMTNKKDENGNLLSDAQRITKFGRFIRATSLDELPQLWNILKGDMSIVGPRPKLIKDTIFYPDYVRRLDVRPGLTCLASVNGRNNNTWESTFIYDNIYVKRMSFWFDVKLIFKTVGAVFSRSGVNDGAGEWQDYYYGNYLLRVGKITKEEYDKGLLEAKKIEQDFINSRSKEYKKLQKANATKQVSEDLNLKEKTSK